MAGCIGALKQSFTAVFPTEISFWAYGATRGPACINAYVFYADGSVDNLGEIACLTSTWTRYIAFDPSKGVTGIEVSHELLGARVAFVDDFAVLAPGASMPEFPLGTLATIALALPCLMLLKSRRSWKMQS